MDVMNIKLQNIYFTFDGNMFINSDLFLQRIISLNVAIASLYKLYLKFNSKVKDSQFNPKHHER